MALSLLLIGDKAMNFLHIPSFGTFNKPLPEALGVFAGDAFAMLKNSVFAAKVAEAEVAQIEEPVVVRQEEVDPNAELAVNLASAYSVVLEQRLQKEEVPIEKPKVEEKKEESIFAVSQEASKPRKKSRHQHSHHTHRSNKK
jgi:hypothetical protein